MKKLCRLCQVKLKYIYFFELISSNYIVYYNIQVV
jgi:hypothetical protein